MSPASYLAAPPRGAVVNCSTPVTIRWMWDWIVFGVLIASTLAVLGALANLAAHALLAWRSVRRARRHLAKELSGVAARIEAAAEKTARAGRTDELEASLARLRRSLARLVVLREAIDEATALVPRL